MKDRHLQDSSIWVIPRFNFRIIGSREGNGEVLYITSTSGTLELINNVNRG